MNQGYDPDERDLPEGWEPELDNDPQWRDLVQLMREADRPAAPSSHELKAIRRNLREELGDEGLLGEGRSGAKSAPPLTFREWLRILFLDQNPGAQFVRMAAVGLVALYAGANFFGGGETTPPVINDSRKSVATNQSAQPEPPKAPSEAPAESDETASVPVNEIAQGPDIRTRTDSNGSMALTRSFRDEQDIGFGNRTASLQTAPSSRAWMFENARPGSGSRMVNVSAENLTQQALDQLQVLKFYSLLNQDEKSMVELRRVERMLSQVLTEEGEQAGEVTALEKYQQAEAAITARRFGDAITLLEEAARERPGSFQAFLAQFQIGRLAFEKLRDYQLALDAYRQCLEEYPAQFITDQNKHLLLERVELLTRTSGHDWKALKHWHAAQDNSDPSVAADQLMEAIKISPYPRLTAETAMALAELCLSDASSREIDHNEVAAVLEEAIDRMEKGSAAAEVTYALAEVTLYRSQNFGQALAFYRRALELQPDAEMKHRIENRIKALMRQRAISVMVVPK